MMYTNRDQVNKFRPVSSVSYAVAIKYEKKIAEFSSIKNDDSITTVHVSALLSMVFHFYHSEQLK